MQETNKKIQDYAKHKIQKNPQKNIQPPNFASPNYLQDKSGTLTTHPDAIAKLYMIHKQNPSIDKPHYAQSDNASGTLKKEVLLENETIAQHLMSLYVH